MSTNIDCNNIISATNEAHINSRIIVPQKGKGSQITEGTDTVLQFLFLYISNELLITHLEITFSKEDGKVIQDAFDVKLEVSLTNPKK